MLLEKLSQACAGPGQENDVRDIIRKEIAPFAATMNTDTLGNLIAFRTTSTAKPRVMVTAHMDEVCLMVIHISDAGLLHIAPVGSIDPRVLVGKVVRIGHDKIPGVIGAKPVHLQKPTEREQALPMEDLFIDAGFSNKEKANAAVKIGDFAYFSTAFAPFGQQFLKGKAFDNRVGCALLVEIFKESYDFPLVAAFTVQEEVGLRGAGPAAYQIEPDLALVLEGTIANDLPSSDEPKHATTLGEGPCLTFMDRSVIAHPKLVAALLTIAENENIPVQMRRSTASGTDAGKIHLSKGGVPTAVISVPCRYIHSPACVLHKEDFANTGKLIRRFLQKVQEGGIHL